jgi:hypothetical protein
MSKHVLPQPPSPTTTIFLEYAGASVMWVPRDSRPAVEVLIMVLTVPSLRVRSSGCRAAKAEAGPLEVDADVGWRLRALEGDGDVGALL